MRPERSRDTGRAAQAARARALVKADLWWVGGHPAAKAAASGIAWFVPPAAGRPARTDRVDGAALHRAGRALDELELRLRDVLDDALDDPRAWLRGARAAVDRLKALLQDGSAAAKADALLATGVFRRDAVARFRAAPASLHGVLSAAAWIALPAPARLGPVADALVAQAGVATVLRRAMAPADADAVSIALALLSEQEGARRVEPLARLLGEAAVHDVPTTGTLYAQAVARAPDTSRTKPAVTLGPALAALPAALLVEPPATRRTALSLLAAVELGPIVGEWAAWWARLACCERALRSPHEEDRTGTLVEVKRLTDRVPRDVHGAAAIGLLTGRIARDATAARHALAIVAEVPALVTTVPARLAFLERWEWLADDARAGAMGPMLGGFARYLERTRTRPVRRLRPWAKVFEKTGIGWGPPDSVLLDEVPAARWPLFYEALARAVEDDEVDASFARTLALVTAIEGDAVRAVAQARIAMRHDPMGGPRSGLRVALELCGNDADAFDKALAAIGKVDDDTPARSQLLRGLAALRRAGGDDLARALLLEHGAQLLASARKLAVLDLAASGADMSIELPRVAAADAAWTATYPAWIQPSLRRLAESTVHAERIARRLLGAEVRSIAAIQRELAHLETAAARGSATDRMRRRAANLRARLDAPSIAGLALRAHLTAKVDASTRRAKLARFERAVDGRVRAALSSLLHVDPVPAWLLEARTVERVAPIATFTPAMRALALRLLRLRAGPPPWDLRDDPANRAFVDRLRRAGVDMGPWLDGVGTQRVTAPNGKIVDLRLEDDPLEVLDMGKHFATCLSPGGENYFSTFANAADINKRVLYARDPAGKVAGRCLLALTDMGGIVTFNAYAHEVELGFQAIVAEFVRGLAARMRVVAVSSGVVPRLVASDWYDDGPVDLGGRFAFLSDGLAFRASVASAAPAAFLAEARALFDPLPLGALTLPLLVALPELSARPELVGALLPSLATTDGVPLDTLARAWTLLAKTSEAAAQALVPRIAAAMRRAARHDADHWVGVALTGVVDACPSDVLRMLRATRPRGARSWENEDDPRRLELAARATEALRRPKAAAALYRLAAGVAWSPAASKALRKRARALESAQAR